MAQDRPQRRRVAYLYELPRASEDEGPPMFAPHPYSPEAKAVQRAREAGLHWAVGVDHRGAWARVDGHEVRAKAPCAEVLTLALEKALAR